ncbi:MAG TPA: RdgB/HAM1 family non-canonical purine NTP pyrophosphatase [Chthoniobacterales bacterium]|nr:RdgB/HAM1 family non-canonical purine NTP pyrophosphatase [Chthoniobacterales bacterium]
MDTNSQKEDGWIVPELVLATRNKHKTREFHELLGDQFELTDLSSYENIELPGETGSTFEQNAILKAIPVSKVVDKIVIADDSGLQVDALGGTPGIYSARYAGENATDEQNIEKLLSELRDRNVADQKRVARFLCVIALAQNGKLICTFSGSVEGTIVAPPRGPNGFGYDPVFQPAGFFRTFGEMMPDLKNRISHRAKAVEALRARLRQIAN